ncbi:MAG: hypothetical protein JSS43_28400 [Proteobacteria bacterium]|nr:hypothetical protein [Pseudomonadota bacterium]
MNRDGPRYSADVDIFHDREAAVAHSAAADAAVLEQQGFSVQWIRREPGIHAAVVSLGEQSTRLEWVRDSDYRFFPAVEDPLFGYRLHLADLATNKLLAAAGRREPRDILDLLYIHRRFLPLGAVVWAAVAKDPGYSPDSVIAEVRRNARYRQDDYDSLQLVDPVDAGQVSRALKQALFEAEAFVAAMPPEKAGLLFLRDGRPVQPDPSDLSDVVEHQGRRGGHCPSSPDIGSAMVHAAADDGLGERGAAG